ncbi:lipopolysaccharide heptosyltransferase I [Aurantivibrio plasticivorans]
MRVLVVKTSSMGDVIHAMPALTDAKRHKPDIVFDWVVEEGFAEIPSWHPAVDNVIPVAIRRWRKSILKTLGSTEWRQFKNQLRRQHYDLVIDCQGLLKSAWVAKLVKAPVAGYDKLSARESMASWFYHKKYSVSTELHAVERIRQLFAQVLGYDVPQNRGDYGLNRQQFLGAAQQSANVVFLHATARDEKLYPEDQWRTLAKKLIADGYSIRLPWGNELEKERAKRIAEHIDGVEVLPRLNIHGVACVLAKASGVVAVDTGLGHLCAALNVPTLSLYGPTDVELIGAYGENQTHLCAKSLDAQEFNSDKPFELVPAELVYKTLQDHVLSHSDTKVFKRVQ